MNYPHSVTHLWLHVVEFSHPNDYSWSDQLLIVTTQTSMGGENTVVRWLTTVFGYHRPVMSLFDHKMNQPIFAPKSWLKSSLACSLKVRNWLLAFICIVKSHNEVSVLIWSSIQMFNKFSIPRMGPVCDHCWSHVCRTFHSFTNPFCLSRSLIQ